MQRHDVTASSPRIPAFPVSDLLPTQTIDSDEIMPLSTNTQTPLETVVDYYLNPDNLTQLKAEKRKQAALAFVALSGAPLYAIPADHYSSRTFGANNIGLRVNYVIGTCVPALIVLYNSTDLFLTIRAMGRVPTALKTVLKSATSSWQSRLEDVVVVAGSAISAVPLTVISLAYPIPGLPKPLTMALAAAVQFDNTVLHFLPIKLAFQNPYYRFPALPFEWLYKNVVKKTAILSPDQIRAQEKQAQKTEIQNQFKMGLLNSVMEARKFIALNTFRFNATKLNYELTLPTEMLEAVSLRHEPALLRLSQVMQFKMPAHEIKPPRAYQPVLQKLLYGLGAFWVVSSCSGYLAATVTELSEVTDSYVAGTLLSSPSIYFLTVLFAFYGGNSLNNVFDYLTSWEDDDVKIPLEFKYFPKVSAFLMLFALYVAAFSYAAADELIADNFDETALGGLYQTLMWLAQTGVPFLSLNAMIGFYQRSLAKLALHYGHNATQQVAQLDAMLENLQTGIMMLPDDDFMNSLDNLPDNELESLTGQTPEALSKAKDTLMKIEMDDASEIDEPIVTDNLGTPKGQYIRLNTSATSHPSRTGFFGKSAKSGESIRLNVDSYNGSDVRESYQP